MEPFVYVGNTMHLRELSSLFESTITLKKDLHLEQIPSAYEKRCPSLRAALAVAEVLAFPSVEHLWQAMKARDVPTLMRFTCAGDLGHWNDGFFVQMVGRPRKVSVATAAQALQQAWRARQFIGLMARKAGKPRYGRALGLDPSTMAYEFDEEPRECWTSEVWQWLLQLKFSQNAAARRRLLDTRSLRLIEFDKGSVVTKHLSFWGGSIDKASGALRGLNMMGVALMQTRAALRALDDNKKS